MIGSRVDCVIFGTKSWPLWKGVDGTWLE
jgi:hypothetical protein